MDGYFYWAHFTGEETEMQKDCGNLSETTQHKRKKRILIRVLFPEPTNEQNKALGELGCGFAESSRKDYVCSIVCMTRYTGPNDPPSVISCGLHGSCDRSTVLTPQTCPSPRRHPENLMSIIEPKVLHREENQFPLLNR